MPHVLFYLSIMNLSLSQVRLHNGLAGLFVLVVWLQSSAVCPASLVWSLSHKWQK